MAVPVMACDVQHRDMTYPACEQTAVIAPYETAEPCGMAGPCGETGMGNLPLPRRVRHRPRVRPDGRAACRRHDRNAPGIDPSGEATLWSRLVWNLR